MTQGACNSACTAPLLALQSGLFNIQDQVPWSPLLATTARTCCELICKEDNLAAFSPKLMLLVFQRVQVVERDHIFIPTSSRCCSATSKSAGCFNQFTAEVIATSLRLGLQQRHLDNLKSVYSVRMPTYCKHFSLTFTNTLNQRIDRRSDRNV